MFYLMVLLACSILGSLYCEHTCLIFDFSFPVGTNRKPLWLISLRLFFFFSLSETRPKSHAMYDTLSVSQV